MKIENGKVLTARELLLKPEREWPLLRAELTEQERKEVAQKLAAMTLVAGRLASFLDATVKVAVA
jgi:hypothetical protein